MNYSSSSRDTSTRLISPHLAEFPSIQFSSHLILYSINTRIKIIPRFNLTYFSSRLIVFQLYYVWIIYLVWKEGFGNSVFFYQSRIYTSPIVITFEEEWFKRNEIKFWTNIFSIVVHSTNLSLEQEPRLTRDYSTYPSHEQAPDRESNKRWIYTSWTRFQKSSPGRDNTRRGGERNSGAAITPIKLSLRREKHRSINPSIVPPSLLPTNKRISPVKILRSTLKQAQREREGERKGGESPSNGGH